MNKKVMLFPILALLLLSVPMAIAGEIHVEGDGTYSQTTEFGEISDAVTLTGVWIFDSVWSQGASPGSIANMVTLFDGSTYHEHAISPEGGTYGTGNPGVDLLTIVNYGDIQDIADIQIRGFDFVFDASTNSPYESDKHLQIWDSHNYYTGGMYGNDQVPDISENRDTATFQVIDTSESIYVVGGSVEYMKSHVQYDVTGNNVFLDQTFTNDASDSSVVTSGFFAIHHIVATAYFGSGESLLNLDWYGEATMDIKGNDKHDILYAKFVDAEADFYLKWSCDSDHFNYDQRGKDHPMYLSAYSDSNFIASGNAEDIGSAGMPQYEGEWQYEAPTGQWTFTGTDFYRADGNSKNWLASYDMEPELIG